jgi:hypothetical protein
MALGLLGSYLSSSSEDEDEEETKTETKEEEEQKPTQLLSNPFGADSSSSISRAGPSYLLEVHVKKFFRIHKKFLKFMF